MQNLAHVHRKLLEGVSGDLHGTRPMTLAGSDQSSSTFTSVKFVTIIMGKIADFFSTVFSDHRATC